MAVPAALTVLLALASTAAPERVLLCRPNVAGDARLARADALVEAAKPMGRFLDYGVACEDAAEGARAARRVGLGHAVSATAEGRGDGSRFVLVLSEAATETERARRGLEVLPGQDAVTPLRDALGELLLALPPPPGPRHPHLGAWITVGAGAAARSSADAAAAATDPAAYTQARDEWKTRRTASGVLLGVGAVAVAAGLTWRYAF